MDGVIACAGAVVFDDHGRLLLVLRRNEPAAGTWSLPGGRQEPGETPQQCAVREVAEETGLEVVTQRSLGVVTRVTRHGSFLIRDFACSVVGGEARPGDDAVELRWADRGTLSALDLAPGLLDALADFGVLGEVAFAADLPREERLPRDC